MLASRKPTPSWLLVVALALLATSAAAQQHQQQQQQSPQSVEPQAQQPVQVYPAAQLATGQQQQPGSQLSQLIMSGAQQLANSPLVPLAANMTATGARYASNVLDLIKDVGKTIQQQVMHAGQQHQHQHQQYQLVTPEGAQQTALKPETIVVTDDKRYVQAATATPSAPAAQPSAALNASSAQYYREQGEYLRREIVSRASQLQQVISSSINSMKSNGDVIARKLLEQLNLRLDQARAKADRIISEPTNNEMAVKALAAVNNGLTNINNMISNLVNRLELAGKEGAGGVAGLAGGQQRVGGAPLTPQLFNVNLAQLRQQFSAAIGAVQRQQQQQLPPQTPSSR